MIYSSGAVGVTTTARQEYQIIVTKRLETSDPSDIDIAFIKQELEPNAPSAAGNVVGDEKKPFAKPRGPARKR